MLVQPSFLGTDNSYLLGALRAHPDRLRGIVVVAPSVSNAALDDMTALGVIGHRCNLLSMNPADLATAPWHELLERARSRLWWTEIQAPGTVWPRIVPTLLNTGAFVMVDHFGLPSGSDCPGIAALRTLDPSRLSLKLSAPYRQSTPAFLEAVRPWMCGPHAPALLWGSDWPWTRHEGRHAYRDCIDWFEDWMNAEDREDILAADIPLHFHPGHHLPGYGGPSVTSPRARPGRKPGGRQARP